MMSVGVKVLLEIIPGSSMRIHKPGPGDIERRWGTNAIGLPEIHHEGFKTHMQYSPQPRPQVVKDVPKAISMEDTGPNTFPRSYDPLVSV